MLDIILSITLIGIIYKSVKFNTLNSIARGVKSESLPTDPSIDSPRISSRFQHEINMHCFKGEFDLTLIGLLQYSNILIIFSFCQWNLKNIQTTEEYNLKNYSITVPQELH